MPRFATRQRLRAKPGRATALRAGARYFQKTVDVDFNALAAGGDISAVLVDRSAVSGTANSMTTLTKAKIQWSDISISDERTLMMGVLRDEESLGATGIALDSSDVVDDYRDEGKLLRGPWMLPVGPVTPAAVYDRMYKTIVLKNVHLDKDQDLYVGFTNYSGGSAFAGSSQKLRFVTTGWHKLLV